MRCVEGVLPLSSPTPPSYIASAMDTNNHLSEIEAVANDGGRGANAAGQNANLGLFRYPLLLSLAGNELFQRAVILRFSKWRDPKTLQENLLNRRWSPERCPLHTAWVIDRAGYTTTFCMETAVGVGRKIPDAPFKDTPVGSLSDQLKEIKLWNLVAEPAQFLMDSLCLPLRLAFDCVPLLHGLPIERIEQSCRHP